MANKMRVRLLALVGVVLVVAIGIAVLRGSGPRMNAEFSQLNAGLVKTFLEQPHQISIPEQRPVLDFTKTLSQKQIEDMKHSGGLPYTSLAPDQQAILLKIAKMRPDFFFSKNVDIVGSRVEIVFKPRFEFGWHVTRDGRPDTFWVGI